jgi:hypothetical protein
VDEVKNMETREGDTEALATLMTELGYPSTVGKMSRRLAWISADPSYVTLVAKRDGRVVGMAGVHLERTTKRMQRSPGSCA